MAVYTEWDALFNAGTSAMFALLGVWILTLKPRSLRTLALGIFALVHGAFYVAANLWDTTGASDAVFGSAVAIRVVGLVVPGMALLVIANDFQARDRLAQRRGLGFLSGAMFVLATLSVVFSPEVAGARAFGELTNRFSTYFFVLSFSSVPLLFALLFRRPPYEGGSSTRRQLAILGMGIVPWPALYAALSILKWREPPFTPSDFLVFVLVTGSGIVWLWNTTLPRPAGRLARNAALVTFGLLAFGMFDAAVLADLLGYSRSDGPFFGIARLATTVVLLLAITRHSVLGVDARIRWGISKSTVAAVILAVIYVASEGAQAAFGADKQWLGLVAGGAVVFAIAPLQRAADRLAEKTVPLLDRALATSDTDGPATCYREQVTIAWSDGFLEAKEHRMLSALRGRLGLSPEDAQDIEDEVASTHSAAARKPRGTPSHGPGGVRSGGPPTEADSDS